MNKPVTLAITGASGVQYGVRLLTVLAQHNVPVYCLLSEAAKIVLTTEYDPQFPKAHHELIPYFETKFNHSFSTVTFVEISDWFSPVASGSSAPKDMVICPCSMSTLSAVAQGASNTVLERAADVVLKERGNLILVPREMPLSAIHLQHMLALASIGAGILPACPSFYSQPQTLDEMIDTVVQRILDQLGQQIRLVAPWGK